MQTQSDSHIPVMANQAIDLLVTDRQGGIYVDVTYGRGGHSKLILQQIHQSSKLFAFDRDPQAIEAAKTNHLDDARFEIIHAKFSRLKSELSSRLSKRKVTGILADLGVSSPQLDDPDRGFSFMQDGPLDLRMDPGTGFSASDYLQNVSEKSLAQVLRTFGQERFARRIARVIVQQRRQKKIETTRQLASLVASSVPRVKNKHPATRTFLALRIHINEELQELANLLPQCVKMLKIGGRLVVLTFHSLEDRIVKNFFEKKRILLFDRTRFILSRYP